MPFSIPASRKIVSLTVLIAVLLLQCPAIWASNSSLVELETGLVQGLHNTTLLGRPFLSFRGIPYGAPPVGPLRFKAPQPAKKWSGVLKAFTEAPACLQPQRLEHYPMSFSEDCLFLNIFTPYLKHPSGKLMPVIVWIHGGKYYQGSGNSYKYGPDFLLKKDVVVVSINYRLGVFGYLNMGVEGAQGNAAMKDKVLALQWIRREISKFGGDPNLVTIWGGSSGASDVYALYISPMGKGLFHRAISHSGEGLCPLSPRPSTKLLGQILAHALGCPFLSPMAAVDCLRTVKGTVLMEAQMIFEKNSRLVSNPFRPSVEEDLGEEMFYPDTPERLQKQTSSAVPFLMGYNNGDGLLFVDNPNVNPDQFTKLDKDFITYLPQRWQDEENLEVLMNVTSKLKDFYFHHNSSLEYKINQFVEFSSDRQFFYCGLKTAQALSTKAPVYFYYFTFEGEFRRKDHDYSFLNTTLRDSVQFNCANIGITETVYFKEKFNGVSHGDELGYFFQRKMVLSAQANYTEYPRDMDLLEKTITLWTNFAAYGDPTPTENKWGVIWRPVKDRITNHLVIGDTLIMTDHSLKEERLAFWDALMEFLRAARSMSDGLLRHCSLLLLVMTLINCWQWLTNHHL